MGHRTTRCKSEGCDQELAFYRSPFTGNLRAFDARPVDGRNPVPGSYPVLGRTAYKFPVLVELIQVQRECTDVEAESEVRDMPWHTIHDCSTSSHHRTDKENQPA